MQDFNIFKNSSGSGGYRKKNERDLSDVMERLIYNHLEQDWTS